MARSSGVASAPAIRLAEHLQGLLLAGGIGVTEHALGREDVGQRDGPLGLVTAGCDTELQTVIGGRSTDRNSFSSPVSAEGYPKSSPAALANPDPESGSLPDLAWPNPPGRRVSCPGP